MVLHSCSSARVPQVSGRLVFVNPSSKSAGLSLHEDIVKKKAHTFQGCTMGDIISDATVTRLDQGQGLLMGLPDGESGYVHVRLALSVSFSASAHFINRFTPNFKKYILPNINL